MGAGVGCDRGWPGGGVGAASGVRWAVCDVSGCGGVVVADSVAVCSVGGRAAGVAVAGVVGGAAGGAGAAEGAAAGVTRGGRLWGDVLRSPVDNVVTCRLHLGVSTGDLLAPDEVAAILGISRTAVRNTMWRKGIKERRGYPRHQVEALKAAGYGQGRGRRTDLLAVHETDETQ